MVGVLDFGLTASKIHNCLVSTTTSICFLIKTNGSKNNVEKPKLQCLYIVSGSCYLQEEKLQIIKIFTTFVKKLKMFSNFLREKGPYTKSEGWKRRQYFLALQLPA